MANLAAKAFWHEKSMQEMTPEEWESLCDGCGLCCQIRLQDEDTDEIILTPIACRFLDLCSLQCSDYAHRQQNVPECIKVTPSNVHELTWLPESCAYRCIAVGKDLPDWHPLKTGDRESVHRAGISMRGALVSEDEADWQDYTP